VLGWVAVLRYGRAVAIVETPHDTLFREAFGSVEAARGLLESLAPKSVLAKLDLGTLTPVPGTFVDEALAKSQSDLLFSVTLAGRPALVYFLLEHKSYPDRWVGLQLAAYVIRIWEKSRQQKPPPKVLPPVIPLVVYHGPSGWTASTRLLDLVDPVVHEIPELARVTPSLEFLLDDLTHASDKELFARAIGLFAQIAAILLRDARDEDRVLKTVDRLDNLWHELWNAPDGPRAVGILLRYLWAVSEADETEITKAIEKSLPEAHELIMTIAEQLRQKGLQQGLQQGLQRGQVRALRKQLELRFGTLDQSVLQRLEAADEETLDRYVERVLTASSLDEVFAN
jgi:predicted transposase YdaD